MIYLNNYLNFKLNNNLILIKLNKEVPLCGQIGLILS